MYANYVTADITAHVDAWQVEFQVDNQVIQREFVFNVAHAYPGMETQSKQISETNTGEKDADFTYDVKMVRIFDDVYVAQEAVAAGYTAPTGATIISQAQLLSQIENDYPFHISFVRSSAVVQVNQSASLTTHLFHPEDSFEVVSDE